MILRISQIFSRHALIYPWTLIGVVASVTTLIGAQTLAPLFYKRLIDTAIAASGPTEEAVRALLVILTGIAAVKGIAWISRRVRGALMVRFESRVMSDLAMMTFDRLMRHSYRFFADNFAGALVRRVNKFVTSFETIADQVLFQLLPSALTIAGSLYVLSERDPLLGVTLFVNIAFFFGFNIAVGLWKQKYEVIRNDRDSEATGRLADAIGNSTTIKLFSGHSFEVALFGQINNLLRKSRVVAWGLHEFIGGVQGFIMFVTEVGMIAVGIFLWQKGVLTVGDFVLIQLYLTGIFSRIDEFERVLKRLFESFADAGEMVEILDRPLEIKDVPNAKTLAVSRGDISFDRVTFAFHEIRAVLKDFSLAVAPREKVAFVGSSGTGKTTVTRLLLRFYDIAEGRISIAGQNIAEVTQESLWNAIALVPQEPVLFHRTLRENILYGRRDASDAEVIAAAKRAHCHEFISAFPKGYETYVGERGVKLSGGERQRVAIARAILKNAPILVLDEATSSLDSESEALIQEALHELMREKTVIAIAHRLSTIKEMDRIIVIDDGAIVAEGTHEELLQKDGIYRKLWDIQAGKFIG